jgi:hypothetical protein
MGIREKTFYLVAKIPDLLFTAIQGLLLFRIIFVLAGLQNNPAIAIVFTVTDLIVFPIGIFVEPYFPKGSLKYEFAIQLSGVIYACLYTFIISFFRKLLFIPDEE